MKKQVVAIHGGDTHNSQKEFLASLRSEGVDPEDFKTRRREGWKDNLQKMLGREYEVFCPEMPNAFSAKYAEWKIWFERILKFLHERPIFIGHSLGGIFLARYFAENADKKKTASVFLVAAPYCDLDSKDPLADFVLPKDLSRLNKLGNRLHLYFSEDDSVVTIKTLKEYTRRLPEAQVTVFKNMGHFRMARFPEIVKDIKRL